MIVWASCSIDGPTAKSKAFNRSPIALSRLAAISRPMMESIPTSCSGCDKAKLGSSICMTLVMILTSSA